MEEVIKLTETNSSFANIPFKPLAMLRQGGKARDFVLFWLLGCAIIVPSSVITRYLEWTGLELSLSGMSIYITVYIPMLLCVPIVFWFGYFWAAIPAYLATFLVAYVGGMPLGWILLFSFANPLSLAFYYLSLSILPKHTKINVFVSLIGFVLISLVASLAGSSGSFIWAFANKVGLNNALPVWQGWWVGGWLQTTFIVLPVLYFFSPVVLKLSAALHSPNSVKRVVSYRVLTLATIAFVTVLVGYVATARFISIEQLARLKSTSMSQASLLTIDNAISGMSYPLFILLAVMVALIFLIYKAIIYWSEVLKNANKLLNEKNIELEMLASTDELTQLLMRRKVMEVAQIEFDRARRNSQWLSVLMIDIDKFKRINDEYGHLVGDKVISDVAGRLKQSVRPYDSVGRYGGEEFIVVLPNSTLEDAMVIAERILASIANLPVVTDKGDLCVTVSIGAASLQEHDKNIPSLIEHADQALLSAKAQGRNCIQRHQ
ncbi:diguanylate cyclase [Colwellia sp. M166]|nr:diguanylate cyclase [Colwellia sp. M166]|tara:strand:- start:44590 stop:46059 length:1470 start_codon:yes stop_codon:yes gene_type:complete